MQGSEAIFYVYVKIIPNPSTITLLEKLNALQCLQGILNYSLQVNNHTFSYRIPSTRTILPFPRACFLVSPYRRSLSSIRWAFMVFTMNTLFIFWGPWGAAVLHFLCVHTPLTGSENCPFLTLIIRALLKIRHHQIKLIGDKMYLSFLISHRTRNMLLTHF